MARPLVVEGGQRLDVEHPAAQGRRHDHALGDAGFARAQGVGLGDRNGLGQVGVEQLLGRAPQGVVGVDLEEGFGRLVPQHVAAALRRLHGQGRGQRLDDRAHQGLGLDLGGDVLRDRDQRDHRAVGVANGGDGRVAIGASCAAAGVEGAEASHPALGGRGHRAVDGETVLFGPVVAPGLSANLVQPGAGARFRRVIHVLNAAVPFEAPKTVQGAVPGAAYSALANR